MGPSRPVYRLERKWTCPKHVKPHYVRYEERCDYDPTCKDYECPHTHEVMVDPGCPACENAEWEIVLDPKTGEPIVHYETRHAIVDQMNEEIIFLKKLLREDLNRKEYGAYGGP